MHAPSSTHPDLRLQDVRFSYAGGDWACRIPDLRLGGEPLTCMVGPNGSGKSTLLRIAAGILNPLAGAVQLDGRPLAALPRRKIARRIGFLPQEAAPLFDYPVQMVVTMGRYAHAGWTGALDAMDRRAVDAALSAMALDDLRARPLSRVSGGERRRALIAGVLAQEPDILLLDEPTAALDIHYAAEVMRRLAGVAARGRAVVAVTHDINLAALFADRLILLVNGAVAADGPPADVVRSETIRPAYGEDVLVCRHPETGGPLLVAGRPAARLESGFHG